MYIQEIMILVSIMTRTNKYSWNIVRLVDCSLIGKKQENKVSQFIVKKENI